MSEQGEPPHGNAVPTNERDVPLHDEDGVVTEVGERREDPFKAGPPDPEMRVNAQVGSSRMMGKVRKYWKPVLLATGAVTVAGILVYALYDFTEERWFGQTSSIDIQNDLVEAPKGPISPQYQKSLNKRNASDLEAAREQGNTHIPMIAVNPKEKDGAGSLEGLLEKPKSAVDPEIEDMQALIEPAGTQISRDVERDEKKYEKAAGITGEPDYLEFIKTLVDEWDAKPELSVVTYPVPGPKRASQTTSSSSGKASGAPDKVQLLKAGSLVYGFLKYRVDSDIGNAPIQVQILDGKLRGAVLTGQFSVVDSSMVLQFTKLHYRGREIAVNAFAVGNNTHGFKIEPTDIDHHVFERVILPAAINFFSGYLLAAGRPAVTIDIGDSRVTQTQEKTSTKENLATGLADAGKGIAKVVTERAPEGATITIDAHEELIIAFIDPIYSTGDRTAFNAREPAKEASQ